MKHGRGNRSLVVKVGAREGNGYPPRVPARELVKDWSIMTKGDGEGRVKDAANECSGTGQAKAGYSGNAG